MPSWDANQYLQFAHERTRPCRDLVGRIGLAAPGRVIDLGCGPGNSTTVLAERWPAAEIAGLDSSAEMIEAARKSNLSATWRVGDIASWKAEVPYDLILSNAALQWVPEHETLFPHLLRQVAEGGALAVQMPATFDAVAHRLIRELAESSAWRGYFSGAVRNWSSHEPAFYYDLLAARAKRIDLWMTEYLHVVEGPEAIVAWYKGTGLRPLLDLLEEKEQERFLADYLALLKPEFPRRADGRILFPFLRLFFIAYG
jgi:trans-aconitate 2-methyltransferase